ncbi:MAG: TIGR01212 family radical SAM protein [Muribaculaceae bacterium]|nr:TIGR01212 family radical SAM protein [Muribaculaceae bacterium]
MNLYYKDFGEYMLEVFPGIKVQKLSIDAGFTCPNRDGSIGQGGCIYCNNASFTPGYCSPFDSVEIQIEKGKAFFLRKYPEMKYLAYFQSYTNTFGRSASDLLDMYRKASEGEDVVGVIIGTRPDCLPDDLLDGLAEQNKHKPVILEIGAETSFDDTLRLINRNHTWAQVEDAVCRLHERSIRVGLHLIAGLPGESTDDVIETVRKSCALPIESIKMHQLQIVEGTPLLKKWKNGEIDITPFTLENYLELCVRIVDAVPRHICIERFLASSPPDMVVAPKWGLKNYQFTNLLMNRLIKQDSKPRLKI